MNKYQLFAVNHYLSDYDIILKFDDILAALADNDTSSATLAEAYQHLTLEEAADDIYQMACDLEKLL